MFGKKIVRSVSRLFLRYVVCLGNDTKYLRALGMQIAPGSRINLRKVHVGSEPWLIKIGNDVTIAYGDILLFHCSLDEYVVSYTEKIQPTALAGLHRELMARLWRTYESGVAEASR